MWTKVVVKTLLLSVVYLQVDKEGTDLQEIPPVESNNWISGEQRHIIRASSPVDVSKTGVCLNVIMS